MLKCDTYKLMHCFILLTIHSVCRNKGDAGLDNITAVPALAVAPVPLPPVPECHLTSPGFYSEGVPPFHMVACDPGKSSKEGSTSSSACVFCRSVAKVTRLPCHQSTLHPY